VFEELSSVDGKLLRTVRALFAEPGRLTAEYIAGHRASYVAPLKLYFWMSVLFFFVSSLVPNQRQPIRVTRTEADRVLATATDGADRARVVDSLARAEASKSDLERAVDSAMVRVANDQDAFRETMGVWVPRVMFALVPVFALLVGLVYRSRRMRYPRHLFFALHLHAFAFGVLSIVTLAGAIPNQVVGALLALAAFVVIPVYAVRAMRRVYGGGAKGAVARLALLGALYLPVFMVALFAMILVALLTF
jgi:hypothetical protein